MIYSTISCLILIAIISSAPAATAAQLYKCINNGATTYQNTACESIEKRDRPTVDQLNAERKRKHLEAKDSASQSAAATSSKSVSTNINESKQPDPNVSEDSKQYPKRERLPTTSFSCDSRKYCSQMTSCAEAKYFLSNCSGVKMDGNRDGTPCEQQWCH